jgi:hypothetical protein
VSVAFDDEDIKRTPIELSITRRKSAPGRRVGWKDHAGLRVRRKGSAPHGPAPPLGSMVGGSMVDTRRGTARLLADGPPFAGHS